MADELRLALILLGTLAIGAVILHGIWTVRKTVTEEKKLAKAKQAEEEPEQETIEDDAKAANLHQMEMDFTQLEKAGKDQGLPVVDMDVDSIYDRKAEEAAAQQLTELLEPAEEPPHAEQSQQVQESSQETEVVIEQPNVDVDEPVMQGFSAIDDHHVDTDEIKIEPIIDDEPVIVESESEQKPATPPQEVLMLFVDKKDGEEIDGAKLLPILLTLGFKYGEMEFFHRHEDNAGNGEVLFSLANMYNPGTFDIDKMEQVRTRGLTIFMTLPNAAEPLQTFNMMHNAAKKIADEFGAEVLNNDRQPLDVARVRNYVEKIRKFQV